ncbi:MAG: TatD family nuclease-associated radical SAM protein [Candidatus Gastranaerophilales bacterium]
MSNVLVYELENKIYINLTNRCTNDCIFCLRNDKDDVCGKTLWLDDENFTAEEVIAQLAGFKMSDEVIFCGYGEPLLKYEILRDVAKYLKNNHPDIKIRVNTNGHGNFVNKKNILPELKNLVDKFSVSLNASNSKEYDELSQPKFENAFEIVKDFIKTCSNEGFEVATSIVDGFKGQKLDIEKCEKISNELGAKLRVREWIKNGYS